jgi:hypothetical protein
VLELVGTDRLVALEDPGGYVAAEDADGRFGYGVARSRIGLETYLMPCLRGNEEGDQKNKQEE